MENGNFYEGSLTAGKEYLSYNTKSEEETGNIKTIINSISDEYLEKLEVIKGELVINTTDKKEIKLAQNLGIEVNPYEITDDGELLSSDGNLLLMDENGTLTIPDRVTSIGEGAFSGLEGLKKIIIPGTVKEIKSNAFSNNQDIEEVIINEGVEKIGSKAFGNCKNLQKITIPDSVTDIGNNCFAGDTKLQDISLSKNLKTISTQLFMSCTNLKNIELPENIEKIEREAFLNTRIEKIKFPNKLKEIGPSVFFDSELKEIDTTENDYFEYKNGTLYSKDLKTLYFAISSLENITIENSTETIISGAFRNCDKLETINIPENVSNIGTLVFNISNLKSITVDVNNKNFKADETGNLYSKDGTTLYRLFDTGNVIIKEGVTKIKRGALINDGKIKTITLPESYEGNTEWEVFPTLDYLYLPKKTTNFNKSTYLNVKNLEVSSENQNFKSINNEYILSKDGKELYWVKSSLVNVTIPETVTKIKSYALSNSEAESITLPNNVEEIEGDILRSAKTKKIEISSKIEKINGLAFNIANNLSEVRIDADKGKVSGSPWGNPYGERAIYWKDSE